MFLCSYPLSFCQYRNNFKKCYLVRVEQIREHNNRHIEYAGELLTEVTNKKLPGMQIDNYPDWKSHIEMIFAKLMVTCFAVRRLYYVLNVDALRIVYFAYFNSIIKYGIIFPGKLLTRVECWCYKIKNY
jgi:hypothetical protein